jgi:hypothetical protein
MINCTDHQCKGHEHEACGCRWWHSLGVTRQRRSCSRTSSKATTPATRSCSAYAHTRTRAPHAGSAGEAGPTRAGMPVGAGWARDRRRCGSRTFWTRRACTSIQPSQTWSRSLCSACNEHREQRAAYGIRHAACDMQHIRRAAPTCVRHTRDRARCATDVDTDWSETDAWADVTKRSHTHGQSHAGETASVLQTRTHASTRSRTGARAHTGKAAAVF